MFAETAISWEMIVFPAAALLYFQMIHHMNRQLAKKQPVSHAERLTRLARENGVSEYQMFFVCARDWQVSKSMIDEDFKNYLRHEIMPYYVRDYVRRHRGAHSSKSAATTFRWF